MVVAYHAWYFGVPHNVNPAFRPLHTVADRLFSRGLLGVSLFFVLSGFCLSYPLWLRRKAGHSDWFRPREFLARRCLRILPPYYAALALFLCLGALAHRLALGPLGGAPQAWLPLPSSSGLIAQILLVHNFFPGPWVNGAFWTLGLEWQWYWVFPLLLPLCIRSPLLLLLVCIGAAAGTNLLFPGLPSWFESGLLPVALLQFAPGILAAYLVTHRRAMPAIVPAAACVVSVAVAEMLVPRLNGSPIDGVILPVQVDQLAWGVALAALVIVACTNRVAQEMLRFRPLVAVGTVSYSVYLIHMPLIQAIETLQPASGIALFCTGLAASAAAVAAGIGFFWCVERPVLSRRTRAFVVPLLARTLAWTDWLYGQHQSTARATQGDALSVAAIPVE